MDLHASSLSRQGIRRLWRRPMGMHRYPLAALEAWELAHALAGTVAEPAPPAAPVIVTPPSPARPGRKPFSEPHQVPHVAVRSGEHRASIRISDGELLAGDLPPRVLREVQALLTAHRALAAEAFATTVAFDFPGTLEEMLERATSDADTDEVDDDEQR